MPEFDFAPNDLVFRNGKIEFKDESKRKKFQKLLKDNERLVLATNLLCPPGDPPHPQNGMCGCVAYSLEPRIREEIPTGLEEELEEERKK